MTAISMFEAKTNLSKYVSIVENKKEPYVVIMRNGKPVARIVPYEDSAKQRIGIGKGILPPFTELEEFNSIDLDADFLGDGGIL